MITAARAGGTCPTSGSPRRSGAGRAPRATPRWTMLERPPGDSVQGAPWRVIELPQPGVAVDAAFDVRYGAEMIAIELRHARQALPDDAAERLARAFSRLLDQVLAVPDRPVAAIPLTTGERRRLLALGTSRAAAATPDVFARFTEHAARAPDRVPRSTRRARRSPTRHCAPGAGARRRPSATRGPARWPCCSRAAPRSSSRCSRRWPPGFRGFPSTPRPRPHGYGPCWRRPART